jgi:long-chain acyl-CoA synthetase
LTAEQSQQTGYRNFTQVILRNFTELPEAPALKFKRGGTSEPWQTINYRELGNICMRVAAGLVRRGLNPGERVAILSNNRPEWVYADIGSILAGAISSAIYASDLAEQAEYIINNLDASYLFVEDTVQLEKILQVRQRIPGVRGVFIFSGGTGPDKYSAADNWITPFSELLSGDATPDIRQRVYSLAESTQGEDPMCIVYTSGTTGNSKGAILTHNNYLSTSEMITEAIGDTSRITLNLSFLPLAHAFERFAGYYLVIYLGRTIAYAESLEKITDNFREVQPRYAVCVPRVFEKIHAKISSGVKSSPAWKRRLFEWAMKTGGECAGLRRCGRLVPAPLRLQCMLADKLIFSKVRAAFGGRIEFFVSGGAPLAKELAEFFYSLGILIIEGWGATEGTTPYSLNTPRNFRFGSVGKALPRVHVRIAADGELEVKGPNIFKGYWRNPEETKDAFTPDGYFRTGDIGTIDEEGWIYITDRKKQLIITSAGKNIAPAAVEKEILQGAHIEMAYIHGDRRNYLTALIVLNEFQARQTARSFGMEDMPWQDLIQDPLLLSEVRKEIDAANERMPRFMQVKYFRVAPHPFTVETGELTPTMKLKKRIIEEKYKDLLDSMYE